MSTKHTGMTWTADPGRNEEDKPCWDIHATVNGRMHAIHVASTSPYQVASAEEEAANARLIAAAPELLAALQRLLPDFEIDERAHDGAVACEISVGDVKAARAAIAAATQEAR